MRTLAVRHGLPTTRGTAGDVKPGAIFYAASVLLSSAALMALPKVLGFSTRDAGQAVP